VPGAAASDLDQYNAATAHLEPPLRVCIDIDASFAALGGLVRAGALRSPIRTPADAARLAADIAQEPGLRLTPGGPAAGQAGGAPADGGRAGPAVRRCVRSYLLRRSTRNTT
jgi:D-serine deaminase-like pyridoxal phosphate-dependent protein